MDKWEAQAPPGRLEKWQKKMKKVIIKRDVGHNRKEECLYINNWGLYKRKEDCYIWTLHKTLQKRKGKQSQIQGAQANQPTTKGPLTLKEGEH